MTDKPIFKVRSDEETFEIYADGRIKGFPPGCVVVNRIPGTIAMARSEQKIKCEECSYRKQKTVKPKSIIVRVHQFYLRVKKLVENPTDD